MRVAVLQSAYIPWRGYFDLIASVDLFVIYDDVQYSKGSWRNRNKVKTGDGSKWLTVPVNVALGQPIADVTIAYGAKDWVGQHDALLEQALAGAPHLVAAMAPWRAAVAARPERLSDLNVALLQAYCANLGIATPFVSSADYPVTGASTERLVALLKAVGATDYLSGPAGEAYIDPEAFRAAGIGLAYKRYDYADYVQRHDGFQPDVSIIDVFANAGAAAPDLIRSRSPDRRVV